MAKYLAAEAPSATEKRKVAASDSVATHGVRRVQYSSVLKCALEVEIEHNGVVWKTAKIC